MNIVDTINAHEFLICYLHCASYSLRRLLFASLLSLRSIASSIHVYLATFCHTHMRCLAAMLTKRCTLSFRVYSRSDLFLSIIHASCLQSRCCWGEEQLPFSGNVLTFLTSICFATHAMIIVEPPRLHLTMALDCV
jgi:hypothetical protein